MRRPGWVPPWADIGSGRLAVRMPNWLGDALLAVPALRRLRALAPQARVELHARGAVAEVLAAADGIAERVVPAGGRGAAGLLADARALRGACACVLLPNSIGSALAARLAGVRVRVGFARELRAPLLTHAAPPPRGLHQARYYLALVDPQAAASLPLDGGLALAPAVLARAREVAGDAPYVALVPGAAFGTAKRWGAERFGELGRRLRARGLAPLVLGTASERDLAAAVAAASGGRSLAGSTDGATFAGLLAGARVAAVNDSGALHLAAALGTPLVALFGATDPAATGPIAGRSRVLYHRVACSPCGLRACRLPVHECMQAIDPGEAEGAVAELLGPDRVGEPARPGPPPAPPAGAGRRADAGEEPR